MKIMNHEKTHFFPEMFGMALIHGMRNLFTIVTTGIPIILCMWVWPLLSREV